MNKTYITLIVLILIVGGLFVFGRGGDLEAPTVGDTTPTTESTENAGDAGTMTGTTSTVKEFVVTGQNFSFSPSVMTVNQGDTVRITFKNVEGTHNLLIDEFNVATKVIQTGTEDVVEFVADQKGTFEYYCSIGSHRAMGMWGTLKVE